MSVAFRAVGIAMLASASAWAAVVSLPGGTVTIDALSTTGTSFTYTGTLTQNDTISFTQSGSSCLQTAGTQYCTNGAGVLRVAGTGGSPAVGGSSPFTGNGSPIPASSFTYGSVIMIISGVGAVQVFPTNGANGAGSGAPPATLTLPSTTLSGLGFSAFSVTNPTITFVLGDTGYTDNGGQFVLTQGSGTTGVPISNTALFGTATGLCLLGIYQMSSRLAKRAQ